MTAQPDLDRTLGVWFGAEAAPARRPNRWPASSSPRGIDGRGRRSWPGSGAIGWVAGRRSGLAMAQCGRRGRTSGPSPGRCSCSVRSSRSCWERFSSPAAVRRGRPSSRSSQRHQPRPGSRPQARLLRRPWARAPRRPCSRRRPNQRRGRPSRPRSPTFTWLGGSQWWSRSTMAASSSSVAFRTLLERSSIRQPGSPRSRIPVL